MVTDAATSHGLGAAGRMKAKTVLDVDNGQQLCGEFCRYLEIKSTTVNKKRRCVYRMVEELNYY
jgi:hypothetical protein